MKGWKSHHHSYESTQTKSRFKAPIDETLFPAMIYCPTTLMMAVALASEVRVHTSLPQFLHFALWLARTWWFVHVLNAQ